VALNGEVREGGTRTYELPHQARPLAVVPSPDIVPPVAPVRQTASKPAVSQVIPVKNEARNIAWVLDQVPSYPDLNHSSPPLDTERRRPGPATSRPPGPHRHLPVHQEAPQTRRHWRIHPHNNGIHAG
jgi:hypothetical protein